MSNKLVSIIIPAKEEHESIAGCLDKLLQNTPPFEIIVSVPHGADSTIPVVKSYKNVKLLIPAKDAVLNCRAAQMNAAAKEAKGEYLWFLHADSLPHPVSLSSIRETLAEERVNAGAFSFRLEADSKHFRLIEFGTNLRARIFNTPYGDQGIFIRKTHFERLGAFREIPILEDLYLVRALRKSGGLKILKTALKTSARKWRERGTLGLTALHWKIVLLDWLGVSPERINKLVRGRETKLKPEMLLVFLRYPEPGKAKTRLIPELGVEGAARFYSKMAEHTAKESTHLARKNLKAFFFVEPGEKLPDARKWLGEDLHYMPQAGDDLGARMEQAFRWAFASGAQRVTAIGTDCVHLSAKIIAEGFSALESHDAVVGPAEDGGYYLIGLSQHFPEVFDEIPWSSKETLKATLKRLSKIEASVHKLPELMDVDTWENVKALSEKWQTIAAECRSEKAFNSRQGLCS